MTRKGHPVSPETRAKISATLRGKPKTPEHRAHIRDATQGHPVSPETRAKISAAKAGKPWSPERRATFEARGFAWPVLGECVYCGGPATTRDHVIPRGRPGWDAPDNLVLACHPCNTRKNDRTPEEWRAGIVIRHGPQKHPRPSRRAS